MFSATNIHFFLPHDGMKSSWVRCADLTLALDSTVGYKLFRHILFHYDNNFGAAAKRQWTWRSNTASGDVSRYIVLFACIIIITVIVIIIFVTFQCRKKNSSSLFSNEVKITILWKWDRLPQVCFALQFPLTGRFFILPSLSSSLSSCHCRNCKLQSIRVPLQTLDSCHYAPEIRITKTSLRSP